MHVLPSRPLLWVCLILFITQAAIVDARSKKDKKKIEEETAPNPVVEEENPEPAASGRDARQHSEQLEEEEGPGVNPVNERETYDGDGSERTKKSYCASERSSSGNYNGGEHPHGSSGHDQGPHGPYGRYTPEGDHYPGGGHGSGHGPAHPSGYNQHGPDMTDYNHQSGPHGHMGGHEGYGGEGGKGHPGYARKSGGDYGYGSQGSKGGGEMYHPAASASSSVYRPSYQAGQEALGGGGADYPPAYGHGYPYGGAQSAGGHGYPAHHEPSYAPHSYGPQSPGYGAGHMKAPYGGGVYPPAAAAYGPAAYGSGHAYGPAGPAYGGAAPAYGQLYHGPSGYGSSGYPPHGSYAPTYMPYNSPGPSYMTAPSAGPSYPMPPYPQHYLYGSPPPGYHSSYQMLGPQGVPVTLTCSVQPHDSPYAYQSHSRGSPPYYRASEGDSQPSKPPLTMVVVPSNQNKTTKPAEKQSGKEQQKDQPTHEAEKGQTEPSRPAMAQQSRPEGMRGEQHSTMQVDGGSGVEPHAARESASYQRMPFSLLRQRQMGSFMGPKPVFYQQNY